METVLLAKASGDIRTHATFEGCGSCLCGAPVSSTIAGVFEPRDPLACQVCALALVMPYPNAPDAGSDERRSAG
jgi:hypothetical protein